MYYVCMNLKNKLDSFTFNELYELAWCKELQSLLIQWHLLYNDYNKCPKIFLFISHTIL